MPTQVLNNRYEIESPIGQGGMASVYRARDLRLGRSVAVKILHQRYANDDEFVQRFDHEAMSAASLSAHPHIVDVYDVGEHGNTHYIVMGLIEGEDLKWLIDREAPMQINRALQIVEQVADALGFAHRQGFIHRDIKPQNILIDRNGQAHITDFGIAKSKLSTAVTQAGMTYGTADYISPEQAQGLDVQPQSDIYSLGMVLYEMLTGQLPFKGDTPMAVAIQHIQSTPVAPRQLNAAIPPALETIILQALSKDPRERPDSAQTFAMQLRNFRMGRSQPTMVAPTPSPTQPFERQSRTQVAEAPTTVNQQPQRRPVQRQVHSAPPTARTYNYDDTVRGDYAESIPQRQSHYAPRQPYYTPPQEPLHAAPSRSKGISGNIVTTIFLLLGIMLLVMLLTTDWWIDVVRSLVGM